MRVHDILTTLQNFAPITWQEEYDNSGLQIGIDQDEVRGILIALDCTEDVLDEAIHKKCNVILTHHPILFKGLKRISNNHFVERIVRKAIQNNVNIISWHTNLDHAFNGVNYTFSKKLGLQNLQILNPKTSVLKKILVFCPQSHLERVRTALFNAGAGQIGNYSHCSFTSEGTGTFKANAEAKPFLGEVGKLHQEPEVKLELVFDQAIEKNVLSALKLAHPYEEIAFDLTPLDNSNPYVGSGMLGLLPEAMDEIDFLHFVRDTMHARVIRYSKPMLKKVQKIALCGGSGFFLLPNAIKANADVFITADVKYHDFFEAQGKILLLDIGHYESEQYTNLVFMQLLNEKFPNFAVYLTEINTNSVNYHL